MTAGTIVRVASAALSLVVLLWPGASGARISTPLLSPDDGGVTQDSKEVVNKFCDFSKLHAEASDDAQSALGDQARGIGGVMHDIVHDIQDEIDRKEMEKAAQELATFYMCVRWVPEGAYADLAEAEQGAGTFSVETQEKGPARVAEAYQKFKFVPIRCSKNLAVWKKKSPAQTRPAPDPNSAPEEVPGTFFEHFEQESEFMANWLEERAQGEVAKSLADVDRAFCPDRVRQLTGSDKGMSSVWCEISAQWWANWILDENKTTRLDRWRAMAGNSSKLSGQEAGEAAFLTVSSPEVTNWVSPTNLHSQRRDQKLTFVFDSDETALLPDDPIDKELKMQGGSNMNVTVRLLDAQSDFMATLLAEKSVPFTDLIGKGESVTLTLTDTETHRKTKNKQGMNVDTTVKFNMKVQRVSTEWNREVKQWTDNFPYASFLASDAPDLRSPEPTERILLCFGKRVASELHRRAGGSHILADMNNLGCHGFWDMNEAAGMLRKMVQMWAPPTCQLADLKFRMKSEMVRMATEMNSRFFEALPTMLLSDELGTATPHHKRSVTVNGQVYIDGMRVKLKAKPDVKGTVVVTDGKLAVVWDNDSTNVAFVAASDIAIVVKEEDKSWSDLIADYVPGVGGAMEQADKLKRLANIRGMVTTVSQYLYHKMVPVHKKMTKLAALMSSSTAKWSVCPINSSASLEDLDASLGNEDVNFREWLQEAYTKHGGKAGSPLPGQSCVAADFLDQSRFGQCKVCSIGSMKADHIERYKDEQFVCPSTPMLEPSQQLELLRTKGQCLLHMSDRQMSAGAWNYNGRHPIAKQFDRVENVPTDKLRLTKLLKVSPEDDESQVEMGVSCTLEEWQEAPRFCQLAPIQNQAEDIESVASWLAAILGDSSLTGLGVVTSLTSAAVGLYNDITKEKTNKAGLEHAAALYEAAWRKAQNGAAYAGGLPSHLLDKVGQERKKHLTEKLLTKSPAAELLHAASFQRSTDTEKKETFDRYVVTCPCDKFDPISELATRTVWGEAALRMMRQVLEKKPDFLKMSSVSVQLRGVAALHRKAHSYTSRNESVWLEHNVVATALHEPSGGKPQPPEQWWKVSDRGLLHLVGGVGYTNNVDITESDAGLVGLQDTLKTVRGLEATVWCGRKKDFSKDVGTEPTVREQSLEECIQMGPSTNEDLLAENTLMHYMPDEIVVVVRFSELTSRGCQPAEGAATHASEALCKGAEEQEPGLLKFFGSDSTIMGAYAGAGFPMNTLTEVVMRPEDAAKELGIATA